MINSVILEESELTDIFCLDVLNNKIMFRKPFKVKSNVAVRGSERWVYR